MLEKAILLCAVLAGAHQQLPPEIVLAIRHVEGGRPGLASPNTNKTEDLGDMQINTIWLPELARRYKTSETEIRRLLLNDRCFNIQVGAWILRRNINEAGNFWVGVAWYNSRTPRIAAPYLLKVRDAARSLFGPEVIARGRGAGGASNG